MQRHPDKSYLAKVTSIPTKSHDQDQKQTNRKQNQTFFKEANHKIIKFIGQKKTIKHDTKSMIIAIFLEKKYIRF